MIFQRPVITKIEYEDRKFWCRGYYVDIAEKNAKNKGICEKTVETMCVKIAIDV